MLAGALVLAFSIPVGRLKAAAGCRALEIGDPQGNYLIPGVLGAIPYANADGLDLLMDAYVQRSGETRPGVLVIHGGGWTSGSRVSFVGQFLDVLTASGFNWYSLDYRQGPAHPYPAALDDLKAALAFIRCNAGSLNLDPNRLILLGEDSGAHLAAMLASEKPEGVVGLVTFGAPFDLTALEDVASDSTLRRYFQLTPATEAAPSTGADCGSPDECALTRASPLHHVSEGMPAVLAFHGGADTDVPPAQSHTYCRTVRATGGQCEVFEVGGAIHRPENWTPPQWHYKSHLVDWLYRTLETPPLPHQPHTDPRLQKDVPYSGDSNTEPAAGLKLDAWIPEGPGPFPAVILAHGGGWEAGDKVTYLTPLLEPLAKAGFAWFSIDYRLTPQHPHVEQLEDLRRAVRFVRHEAARFKIDPARIALLGESASGQMAVLVASQPCPGNSSAEDAVEREPCEVQAVVSFYGVYDFLPMVRDASPRSLLVRLFGRRTLDDQARALLRRYSPLYQVHAQMPPLLLIHGTNEFLWQQALALENRLQTLGADYELIGLPGAPHGMENWEGRPEWESYKPRLIEWLRRTLAPE